MEVVQLDITSLSGGSIGMLPNPKVRVFNETVNATFWLESILDDSGKVKHQQLQYVQSVSMDSKVKFDPSCQSVNAGLNCLIKWPHVQVNTLRKVADFGGC